MLYGDPKSLENTKNAEIFECECLSLQRAVKLSHIPIAFLLYSALKERMCNTMNSSPLLYTRSISKLRISLRIVNTIKV